MTHRPQVIDSVCTRVHALLHPEKIIVFNVKTSGAVVTSFKICVVCACCDPRQAEHDIYMHVDCDVPFDALVYTAPQWNALLSQPTSFASRINAMGDVYYVTA